MKKNLVIFTVLLLALSCGVFGDVQNLTDPSTWENLIVGLGSSSFIINGNVTLNGDDFSTTSPKSVFVFNGSYTLDCGGATISGAGLGNGVISTFSNTVIQNCVFREFARNINILDINDTAYSVSELYQEPTGDGSSKVINDVVIDPDGNYVFAGYYAYTYRNRKYSPNGTLIWDQSYKYSAGGDDVDRAFAVQVDQDGNYIFVGRAAGSWYMEKVMPNGTQIWERKYTHPAGGGIARDVAVDDNGDYIIVGTAGNAWGVMKLSSSNSVEWTWSVDPNPSLDDVPFGVAVDHEGYSVIVGYDRSPVGSKLQHRLVRLTPEGAENWTRTIDYRTDQNDVLYDVTVDLEGNYVAVGGDRQGTTATQWRMIKMDTEGNTLLSVKYAQDGHESAHSVVVDQENNYFIAGDHWVNPFTDWSIRKINSSSGESFYRWNAGATSGGEVITGIDIDQEGNLVAGGIDIAFGDSYWRIIKLTQTKNQLSGVKVINTSVYNDGHGTFAAFPNGNVDFTNFICSHINGSGKLVYNSLIGATGTLSNRRTIQVDPHFVSLNSGSSDASDFNADINVTILSESGACIGHYFRASGFHTSFESIIENGEVFIPTESSCQNGITTFRTGGFSGYAYGGNANLTINDSAEGSYVWNGSSADFFAYYVNLSDSSHYPGATCEVRFDDGTGPFTMDEQVDHYNYTKADGFAIGGVHDWNVTCSKSGLTTLTANDTIVVNDGSMPTGVPEFSTWTLIIGLMVIVGGFFAMRRD